MDRKTSISNQSFTGVVNHADQLQNLTVGNMTANNAVISKQVFEHLTTEHTEFSGKTCITNGHLLTHVTLGNEPEPYVPGLAGGLSGPYVGSNSTDIAGTVQANGSAVQNDFIQVTYHTSYHPSANVPIVIITPMNAGGADAIKKQIFVESSYDHFTIHWLAPGAVNAPMFSYFVINTV